MSNETQSPAPLLAPCPFCGGAVMFRKALFVSDGCTDAIIHAVPSNCGMTDFTTHTTDESVITVWNHREPDPAYWQLQHTTLLTAYNELLAAKGGGEWISVEDRLPEEPGFYIACLPGGMVLELFYKEYWTGGITRDCKHPTHWQHKQPLPAPPASEAES